MKRLIPIILLLLSITVTAQGEADNWFFGQNAGIQFLEDGSVIALSGSAMDTNEGCSTISDAEGNLLFYTDGRNVWDRNHVIMPNGNYSIGTGLLGDPSSAQSGIIVPKKGDPNIYYVFTVDEPHHQNAAVFPAQFAGNYDGDPGQTVPQADDGFNNGLNYSIVDLSVTGVNGSIGDVTTRNVHLVTYNPDNEDEIKYQCSEKITAVKNASGSGFWIITHFINNFYAFFVDENGVTEDPVITTINPVITIDGYRRNAIGYIKASPNGSKIAVAHNQNATVEGTTQINGNAYLYDFDNETGIVSNPITLMSDNVTTYGIEFSAQSKKLYVTARNAADISELRQYNLEADDIPASETVISSVINNSTALQLGPNGKIYRSVISTGFLDVINSPEEDGLACDFQLNAVALPAGTLATFGLPPFITSLFSAEIITESTCFGDATEFEINTIVGEIDSITWNFGDGTESTELNPTHNYTAPGAYTVTADVTSEAEIFNVTSTVTISSVPIANQPTTLTECDPDNDGVTTFNLTNNNANVLGGQLDTQFEVRYYESQENADNDTSAVNATAFTNTTTPQTLYVRIQNRSNTACYATSSFQINTSNTPVLNDTRFSICDDAIDGNDANGQATFNLTEVTTALVQDTENFTATYYRTEANAEDEDDALPEEFYNTTANEQVVFIRVVNTTFAECFAIEPITLIVNPLPTLITDAVLVQCDLGVTPDGITQFNLEEANNFFTNDNPDILVTYYENDANATTETNIITGVFTNTENPQIVSAKVTNTTTGCFRILPLTLAVNTNGSTPIVLTHCDDDGTEDGLYAFNLEDAGLENEVDSIVYYANATDALLEQNAIGLDYTNTDPYEQSVYARVENDNDCTLLQEIQLVVYELPDIVTEEEAIVCNNTGAFIRLDSGVTGNPANTSYLWSTGATTSSILVNEPGIYSVTVTNSNGCEKARTITVAASDVAIINDVIVTDLVDNNTVTVLTSPTGGVNTIYKYSLDLPEGPFQTSNIFENVTPGLHTVYVYDTNGCGIVSRDIAVLSIPKFFTPNGDGVNETWQIVGINSEIYAKSKIYVYDRYGKLITGVSPRGIGWDGYYNGDKLPATDYWYVIRLEDGRTVKGHFSLVR
ncbi:T9SS type B sorting domain-containing protein [Flavobacterium litorale]|uniref:T9SS type B sorting domain-containing protein n=1 Tax=Flavobacterium litorale TaxID=2856519 RepID=A0ABX8VBH7_9FLAO|nr:T9SS type B sorting domain-containing protein [Flavobacterium litorale]QYJ68170.1 T9SS type B sorting domain-containing protein [Flavobacterium litorale]